MKKNICIIWASSGVWLALSEYYRAQWNTVDTINRRQCDLSNDSDTTKLCQDISKKKYDILIYAAGVWYYKIFEKLTDTETQEQVSVNTLTPLRILQSLQEKTKFVYLSSIMRYSPAKNMSVYAGMKQATSQTLRTLRIESSQRNILNIDLGAIKTPMHIKAGMWKMFGKEIEEVIPKLVYAIENKQGSIILLWQWKILIYLVFPFYRIYCFFILSFRSKRKMSEGQKRL